MLKMLSVAKYMQIPCVLQYQGIYLQKESKCLVVIKNLLLLIADYYFSKILYET